MAPLRGRFSCRGENRAYEPTAANIELLDGGENAFRESVDAGHRVERRAQKLFVLCVALVVLYLVAIVFPKGLLDPGQMISATARHQSMLNRFIQGLGENIEAILAISTGTGVENETYVPTMLRYIAVPLAGMGLAVSGAVYQGVFRNALVAPSTLGVMTGGQFGMTLWVVVLASLGVQATPALSAEFVGGSGFVDILNTSIGLSLTSFAGCFLVVGIVLLTLRAAGTRKTSGIMMILTGQVVGGIFGVFGTLARYYYVTVDPYGPTAEVLQSLAAASFYRAYTWIEIAALVAPLAITYLVVRRLSQKMMVLSLDEAEQRSMGIDTRRMQVVVVGLCTLLTAVIISFCGSIGFVGFLVPHLARRLVGPNFKYLLPASMLLGGIFVLGSYFLVDATLGADFTQMTGMFISIGGAAVFLVTALRGEGVRFGSFR